MNKTRTALIAFLIAVTVSAAEPRTWTSTSGASIDAEYVELNGANIVLQPAGGKPVSIALDRLIPADREIARAFAVAAGHMPDEGSGAVTPATPNGLQCFADGTWKGQHTVYESDYYRAVLSPKGHFSIQPRVDGADVGEALTHRFRASYHDLSKYKGERHCLRRIATLDNPPAPAIIKTGKHEVSIVGTWNDDIEFAHLFSFEPRRIRVTARMDEPSSVEYPSSAGFTFRIDESEVVDDYKTLDELKERTKGWEVTVDGPEISKTTFAFWESVKRKIDGVEHAIVKGPWGKRTLTFDMPPSKIPGRRDIYSTFNVYRGMPPVNGFGLGRQFHRGLATFEVTYTIEIQ